jgi:hypothetical protein
MGRDRLSLGQLMQERLKTKASGGSMQGNLIPMSRFVGPI